MADDKLTHADGCDLTKAWRAMPLPDAAVFASSARPLVSLGQCTCHYDRVVELEARHAALSKQYFEQMDLATEMQVRALEAEARVAEFEAERPAEVKTIDECQKTCPRRLDAMEPDEVFAAFPEEFGNIDERQRFQRSYDAGVQHVSEILRTGGWVP